MEAGKREFADSCLLLPLAGLLLTLISLFRLSSGKALQTVTQNLQRLQAPGQSGQSWLEP